ncbi:CHAP domain-containing protein [Amycolatopsis sp. NPDC059021]|uniref:CHAP domain-containing protein n=1 Tax=Amycolatopsis sp. NPDC059021 TaxID=3346704 RepID=UPI00366FAFB5
MRRPSRAVLTLAALFAFAVTGTTTAAAAPAAQPVSMAAEYGTVPASATAGTIGDIYPAKWRNVPQDSVIDDWNMYNRECVSWAAFTIARHGKSAANYGDAKYWDDNARNNGFRVDNTPTAGSIAQTDNGRYGHVAIVDSVHGDTVTVEDYNWTGDGHYLVHDVKTAAFRYIHFYG